MRTNIKRRIVAMSKTLKIGIIGCGNVAFNRHAPVLKSLDKA